MRGFFILETTVGHVRINAKSVTAMANRAEGGSCVWTGSKQWFTNESIQDVDAKREAAMKELSEDSA